jgi:gluconolactonase
MVLVPCALIAQISLPSDLVSPSATLEVVASGLDFTEGPVTDSEGNLYFTDTEGGGAEIWTVPAGGGAASVYKTQSQANGANGLVVDTQDRLLACEFGGVGRWETGGTHSTIASGAGVDRANDITLCSDGGFFFTDPIWDGVGDIFYMSSGGTLTRVATNLQFPNGLEYVEEKNLLYVSISQRNEVWTFIPNAGRTSLSAVGALAQVNVADGLALDERGNLWVASNGDATVEVFDSLGNHLGRITCSGQSGVQNCAFGGTDNKVLYITATNTVYKLDVLVSGRSTRGDAVVRTRRPAARRDNDGRSLLQGPSGRSGVQWPVDICTLIGESITAGAERRPLASGTYVCRESDGAVRSDAALVILR